LKTISGQNNHIASGLQISSRESDFDGGVMLQSLQLYLFAFDVSIAAQDPNNVERHRVLARSPAFLTMPAALIHHHEMNVRIKWRPIIPLLQNERMN